MRTTVSIPGIHCAACSALIKDISSEFAAIKGVNVDIDTKQVTVEHDDDFDFGPRKKEIESLDAEYSVFPL